MTQRRLDLPPVYICSADGEEAGRSSAYIEVVEVALPHAGLP